MTDNALRTTPPALLDKSYVAARQAFTEAADQAGAELNSTVHPLLGLNGEELSLDIATLGPPDAHKRVMIVSGTHGVEGFCGSALQTQWLRGFRSLPPGLGIVFVHALNPYGFSWIRRVNEDNIDLNRNFIDWNEPLPRNDKYDNIARLLVPEEFDSDSQTRTFAELASYAESVGLDAMQEHVSSGQYSDPTGVFYGGAKACWSHVQLENIWAEYLHGARQVAVIDLHTGLGPWGHGELIANDSASAPGFTRATALWGDVRSMADGDSVSAQLTGDWLGAIKNWSGDTDVTACALEFGTVDAMSVLLALRRDAWLHAHGEPLSDDGNEVRAEVRAAFADDDPAWIATCWTRFIEVLEPALRTN